MLDIIFQAVCLQEYLKNGQRVAFWEKRDPTMFSLNNPLPMKVLTDVIMIHSTKKLLVVRTIFVKNEWRSNCAQLSSNSITREPSYHPSIFGEETPSLKTIFLWVVFPQWCLVLIRNVVGVQRCLCVVNLEKNCTPIEAATWILAPALTSKDEIRVTVLFTN